MAKPLQEQLKQLLKDPKKVRDLKTSSGKTLGQVLKSEAQRLRNLIQHELDSAISSYQPKGWYYRTGHTQQSLEDIYVDKATNSITIQFNHNLADHDSYFTQFYPGYDNKMFTPLAINEGYKLLHSNKRYPSTNYLEKAIAKFNQNKHDGITVRLEKSGANGVFYDEYL